MKNFVPFSSRLALVLSLVAGNACACSAEPGSPPRMGEGGEAPAAAAAAIELEYVTGALFWTHRLKRVDTSDAKLMYPLLSGDWLVFLEIADARKTLHAYDLRALLSPSGLQQGDTWSFTEKVDSSPAGVQTEPIRAVFEGPAFTTVNEDESTLFEVPGGEVLRHGSAFRDYLAPDAWITPEGLFRDGRLFFTCRDVFDADRHGPTFAVFYKDDDNRASVCLLRRPTSRPCGCDPISDSNEYDPLFSDNGDLLAVAASSAEGRWDLHIYDVSGGRAKGPVSRHPGIRQYDITNRDFSYNGSYTWLGDNLFFMGAPLDPQWGAAAVPYRMRCSRRGCRSPARLQAPACLRLETSAQRDGKLAWIPPIDGTCEPPQNPEHAGVIGQVDVESFTWIQPYSLNGSTYVVAEAVVRPQHRFGKEGYSNVLTRIMIFRLTADGV